MEWQGPHTDILTTNEEHKNIHYQLRKKAASENKWELKEARQSSRKTEGMWKEEWECLNWCYNTKMSSLSSQKQQVNLCIMQETEAKTSLQLL